MSFFDAPWHIVLLLLAALLLFGSSRLPGAAKALGQSMNIFKKAVKGDEDDQVNARTTQATFVPPAPPVEIADTPSTAAQQAQIDDLQRQLRDLQRQQTVGDTAPSSETQSRGPSY
jgi:sec-independent protein translocase protein TatA